MSEAWRPLPVSDVAGLFAGAPFRWWIAGGCAIELHLGRRVRDHGDVDVGVLHRDHAALRRHLAGWDVHVADPPGTLRLWDVGGTLPARVHDVWCRRDVAWELQVVLDDADGDDWVWRRDPSVRRPLADLVLHRGGVPYLAPEVVLLWKAKATRPRDEADFEAIVPVLGARERAWLTSRLPADHPWRGRLQA